MATTAMAVVGVGPLLALGAAPASATTIVDSGSGWTVTEGSGGYTVALTLDSPITIGNNYPVLLVDGKSIGEATESGDGLTLTVTTSDPSVAKAKSVMGEMAGGGSIPTASTATTTTPKAKTKANAIVPGTGPTLADDPTTNGGTPFLEGTYNFGAQASTCLNLGGVKCEVEGKYYLPTTAGPHPLVIFLHGRHSSCYKLSGTTISTSWPCPVTSTSDYEEIPSWAGYDSGGEALASNGYVVVSIGANAINANDASFGADAGAAARGQEILDTLTWLQKANNGQTVSMFDAYTNTTRDLNAALANGLRNAYTGNLTATQATAADFVGKMDFNDIGIMGHSRGGEGAATAVTLNAALPHPFNIKSAFLLAPIDFTRDTVPDVITTTLLPYCDGDVSDQQGEHFYADSRNNTFSDNVLRSDILVMGTDHDFYNQDWTPPTPSASDDWSTTGTNGSDPTCSSAASQAATSTRLSAAQQFQVGGAYLAGFFEATLGGKSEFNAMFDGSQAEPPSVASYADVRTWANQPSSDRDDITTFADTNGITTTGNATDAVCANRDARTATEALPYCYTSPVTVPATSTSSSQLPYWTPASYAPNVPLNTAGHLTWTAGSATDSDTLTVAVPAAKQNVSSFQELALTAGPDSSVVGSTAVNITVSDTGGHSYTVPMSSLNKWTVTRMPGGTSTNLGTNGKLIPQQLDLPVSTLASNGVDTTHIASVTLTVVDPTVAGGEYLQDLTFDTKSLGTPNAITRSSVNVASTKVEEGNTPGTDEVAVYLNQASSTVSTAYLTVVGAATKLPVSYQQVTFQPGETCKSVTIPTNGDTATSTTGSTAFKIAVGDSTNAVLGANDFGTVTVREDDGVTGSGVALAPFGTQGDACTEFAALSHPGSLVVPPLITAGTPTVITGSGYRNGESVTITGGGTTIGTAIADASGNFTFTGTVPTVISNGTGTIAATGLGSQFVDNGTSDIEGGVAATPSLPEAPLAALLPIGALAVGGAFIVARRRRRMTIG